MKRFFAYFGGALLFSLALFSKIEFEAVRVVLAASLTAFIVFILIKRLRFEGTLPIIALAVSLGCVLILFYGNKNEQSVKPFDDKEEEHFVVGQVEKPPYINNSRIYYIIKATEIDGRKTDVKIRISSTENLTAEAFDIISGEFYIYRLGEYSEQTADYHLSKNLILGAYTLDYSGIRVKRDNSFHLMKAVYSAKQKVVDTLTEAVPNEYGGLLEGFLLGDKDNIPPKTLNAFSLIGSYHLLAVSGLHVTIWALFVYSFLNSLRIKRRLCAALSIIFVLFFQALTGFNPPVVRAGTMMIFVFLGKIGKREPDSLNSIGLAVTAMLIFNPYAVLSESLWLSVFSSAGIILFASKISKRLNVFSFKNKYLNYFKSFVMNSFGVSLSAVLFTLPLTVMFFGRFSLVSPIANVVLIEVASVTMLLTGFAVLLHIIRLKIISFPLFFVATVLSRFITEFSVWLSGFRGITVSTDYLPLKISAFLIPAVLIIILLFKSKKKRFPVKAVSFVTAVLFSSVCLSGIITEKNRVRIYVSSVEEGICVILNDNLGTAVFGCGGNSLASYPICDIMDKEGVSAVDFLFAPSWEKEVCSCVDVITENYGVEHLHVADFGKWELWGRDFVHCCKDYAYIKTGKATVLVLFSAETDFSLIPDSEKYADYLISYGVVPKNIDINRYSAVIVSSPTENYGENSVYCTTDGTVLLEVKQNGRARIETAVKG